MAVPLGSDLLVLVISQFFVFDSCHLVFRACVYPLSPDGRVTPSSARSLPWVGHSLRLRSCSRQLFFFVSLIPTSLPHHNLPYFETGVLLLSSDVGYPPCAGCLLGPLSVLCFTPLPSISLPHFLYVLLFRALFLLRCICYVVVGPSFNFLGR